MHTMVIVAVGIFVPSQIPQQNQDSSKDPVSYKSTISRTWLFKPFDWY